MWKIILLMLLAITSSSAAAKWIPVSHNEETPAIYADRATIRKAGNKVRMWELTDYKTAQKLNGSKPYMSTKIQHEYDCKKEKYQTLYLFAHSGNMGAGKVVSIATNRSKWTPVLDGSIDRILWEIACAS